MSKVRSGKSTNLEIEAHLEHLIAIRGVELENNKF